MVPSSPSRASHADSGTVLRRTLPCSKTSCSLPEYGASGGGRSPSSEEAEEKIDECEPERAVDALLGGGLVWMDGLK